MAKGSAINCLAAEAAASRLSEAEKKLVLTIFFELLWLPIALIVLTSGGWGILAGLIMLGGSAFTIWMASQDRV